jgi:hypothetical protein
MIKEREREMSPLCANKINANSNYGDLIVS